MKEMRFFSVWFLVFLVLLPSSIIILANPSQHNVEVKSNVLTNRVKLSSFEIYLVGVLFHQNMSNRWMVTSPTHVLWDGSQYLYYNDLRLYYENGTIILGR